MGRGFTRARQSGAVIPSAEGLVASINATKTRGLPPVHLWNPPFCGDLDMRIARDGTWFYEGTPIGRPALVKMFSSILKRENGKYFLVTPVEKVGIIVDDAPFVALDFDPVGQGLDQDLTFTTHVNDVVVASVPSMMRLLRASIIPFGLSGILRRESRRHIS